MPTWKCPNWRGSANIDNRCGHGEHGDNLFQELI